MVRMSESYRADRLKDESAVSVFQMRLLFAWQSIDAVVAQQICGREAALDEIEIPIMSA
jgi:hypothetical protein